MHCFLKYWLETLANILKLIKFAHNIEIRQTEQITEETKQPKTETGANNKGFGDSTRVTMAAVKDHTKGRSLKVKADLSA